MIVLKYKPTVTEILPDDNGEKRAIQEILTVLDPHRNDNHDYKSGVWDGNHKFYYDLLDERPLSIPSGLLPWLRVKLREADFEYTVENGPRRGKRMSVPDNLFDTLTLRPYQVEAVQTAIWAKRGVLSIPPRCGKTVCQAAVAAVLDVPSLLLIHQENLLIQHHKLLGELGLDVGRVGSEFAEWKHKHIVATVQTLYKGLKRGDPKTVDMLRSRKLIQSDETHHVAAETWSNVFLWCKAEYRLGWSGTPFIAHISDAQWNARDFWLRGHTGKLIYEASSAEMRDQGYLAEPTIYMLNVTKPRSISRFRDYRKIYKMGIVANKMRNDLTASLCMNLVDDDRRVLALVNHIPHGKTILQRFIGTEYEDFVAFAKGGGEYFVIENGRIELYMQSEPNEVLNLFEDREFEILIGTTVFDEGVNIPSLDAVILAGGGKAPIGTTQRAYRGMTKAEGKKTTLVFDFNDTQHGVLRRHSAARVQTFGTQGLKVYYNVPEKYRRRRV